MEVAVYKWKTEDTGRYAYSVKQPICECEMFSLEVPDGWEISKNYIGEDMLFNENGNHVSLENAGGNIIAAVSIDGIKFMKQTLQKKLENKIADVMKEKGVSVAALAGTLGVQNSRVSEWRTGTRVPKAETLAAIAQALDCKMEDLI